MRKLIVLAILVALGACASDESTPLRSDAEGFDAAWRDFGAAFDELETAVRATPRWEMRPEMKDRVATLAAIAEDRAERLRPWEGGGLVSAPAIALIEKEVAILAGRERLELPRAGADLLVETEVQRRRFDQERAWQRLESRIDLLEAYAAAGAPLPWLERRAFRADLAALDLLGEVAAEDLAGWRRTRVSADTLQDMIARGEAIRTALGGGSEAR